MVLVFAFHVCNVNVNVYGLNYLMFVPLGVVLSCMISVFYSDNFWYTVPRDPPSLLRISASK